MIYSLGGYLDPDLERNPLAALPESFGPLTALPELDLDPKQNLLAELHN